MPKKKLKT